MTIKIRAANFKTDIAFLRAVRETVFVEEQSVPLEMEWDQHDPQAYHLLAFADDTNPVATARLLDSGKIGRMAVLRKWRHRGIGTALLSHLINEATERGLEQVYLSPHRSLPSRFTSAWALLFAAIPIQMQISRIKICN